MIHCIGDSHSAVFSGKEEMQPIWPQRSDDITEYFKSYRIGPATAYQVRNKIPIINDIISKTVKENDKVLFCFGEVDCRAHIKKQSDLQNRPINDVIKECVDRYFSVIKEYKDNGLDIMIWGPIASWSEERPYTGPSFGTCQDRNSITKEFNRYLKELCDGENIIFISIFHDMVDSDTNITKTEYLDDWEECHMHLSQRAMPLIIEKFKNIDLI